ncbi:MAG: ABC transporter ATP-binding protein [Verrucomicrobiota bacterium]
MSKKTKKTGTRPHACPPGESVLLEIRDVHKAFGGRPVLRGIDLDIYCGEVLVILGTSGCGKSVLLKTLLGLIVPDRGNIRIDGSDICGVSERGMAPFRKKIGILFQNGALFDSLSVEENVAFPLRESGITDEVEIHNRVSESLEVVGLKEHLRASPGNLSGGMRKRVALARAVVDRPSCVLYDEPTAGLDPIMAGSIDRLIRTLCDRFSMTSIVVTHNMKSVDQIADRVAYLKEGRVYFTGSKSEFEKSEDPLIRDFVEGRASETVPLT